MTFLPTLKLFVNVSAQVIGSRFSSYQNNTLSLAAFCRITGKCYISKHSAQSTTASLLHSALRCRRSIESDDMYKNNTVDVTVFSVRQEWNTCSIHSSCSEEELGWILRRYLYNALLRFSWIFSERTLFVYKSEPATLSQIDRCVHSLQDKTATVIWYYSTYRCCSLVIYLFTIVGDLF